MFFIREHFDSKEKERPTGGGYKREFWTPPEYNASAHSAPRIMQSERGSRRGAFSPRSRATFRPMPDRQPISDPRFDEYRRRDALSAYDREMAGRNEVPTRREFDDSFYDRNGRFDEPSRETFHNRPVNRPAQHYEPGTRAMSASYRGRPSRPRVGYEPRPEVHRQTFNRDRGDWVDARRPASPKRGREEPEARNPKVVAERRKSFDRPDARTSYKTLVSSDSRRNERPSDRTSKTSMSRNPQSPAEAETRPTPRTGSSTRRDSARSSSSTKREFDRELRPEEILVTRRYQNTVERKESALNIYPDEERHVKIVRETSSNEAVVSRPGKGSGSAGGSAQARPGNQKFEVDHDGSNSEVSSSSSDVGEAPQMDARGDTDERGMSRALKSQPATVKLQSKLRDFGDKDDRPDRPKIAEKEIFCFDNSRDVSPHTRSESRDEEGPRERFDRRVNTRDPDDLRNSLARRRKMQNTEPSERVPENGLPSNNKPSKEPSRDSVKRRSADNSPSRSRDRREASPKRRRLSEGHHFRPAMSAFKRPFAVPRRNFSYRSSSIAPFRGRRYPTALPSSGRGLPRDLPGRRFPRANFPRGMAFRRGAARQ